MSTYMKKYEKEVKSSLIASGKYKNVMEVPRLHKIVVSRGMGEAVKNSKVVDLSVKILLDITGQKPILTKAKKSISNFSLREGQVIGCKVTLRGKKMYDFFTKLQTIVFPKIRDFRGLSVSSFDGKGNYTFGIKEDVIFPEAQSDFDTKVRGFNVTLVMSSKKDEDSLHLLNEFKFPFRRQN